MSRDLTDALSKLFIKLGGKTSDSKENKGPVDYIDDITGIVEPGGGGGSGLPEVTDDDNGDILKVMGGEWSKAKDLGPDKFDVTYADSEFDRTSEEIISAFEAGKTIRFMVASSVLNSSNGDVVMYPSNYEIDDNGDLTELGFIAVYKTNSSSYATMVFRIDLTETDPTLSYASIDIN